MYVRDLAGNEYPCQSTITVSKELNGNQSLSTLITPTKVNDTFIDDIAEMWEFVDDEDTTYKIVFCKRQGAGKRLTVDIKALPMFFDRFDNDRIYETYNQHMTAFQCFSLIFDDTEYDFVLVDAFAAVQWEGFGARDTRLENFKRALNRYKCEFRIVGNTIYLESVIGNDTAIRYEHRLNASDITQEIDASGFWTYAKGYGDFAEGEEDNALLIREYTSPLAAIPSIGIRHAPPITNGNITQVETMDEQLKLLVDESLMISVSANITDLRKQKYPIAQAQLGDRVFLIDPRIGFEEEVRVVDFRITKDWRGNILNLEISFGTPGLVRRRQADINTAIKRINDLYEGKTTIPISFLDNRIKEISNIINGNQDSIFQYTPNGVIGRNGDNPNYMTRYVGDALGFSTDGGVTYGTAISAELGIVADYMTTGTLRSILIEGVEIRGATFVSEDEDTAFWVSGGNMQMLDDATGRTLNISASGIYGYNANNSVRFQADAALVTSAAFGTSNANTYMVTAEDGETRSVSIDSIPGGGLITDYTYVDHRAKGLWANTWGINVGVPGTNMYVWTLTDGELRCTLNGTTDIYRDMRNRTTFTNRVRLNTLFGLSENIFLNAVNEIRGTSMNSDDSYIPFRGSGFIEASSERFKDNIEPWEVDAISIIKGMKQYTWNPKDKPNVVKYGDVVEYAGTPLQIIEGDGINQPSKLSLLTLGLQQVIERLEALEAV